VYITEYNQSEGYYVSDMCESHIVLCVTSQRRDTTLISAFAEYKKVVLALRACVLPPI